MKIAKKITAQKFQNSKNCIAWEYPLNDKDINGVVIELTGKYPERGWAVNEKCKELVYVIEGEGELKVEGKTEKIGQGDVMIIEPGEKYQWTGNLKMFMPGTPAWEPGQHKIVTD